MHFGPKFRIDTINQVQKYIKTGKIFLYSELVYAGLEVFCIWRPIFCISYSLLIHRSLKRAMRLNV